MVLSKCNLWFTVLGIGLVAVVHRARVLLPQKPPFPDHPLAKCAEGYSIPGVTLECDDIDGTAKKCIEG